MTLAPDSPPLPLGAASHLAPVSPSLPLREGRREEPAAALRVQHAAVHALALTAILAAYLYLAFGYAAATPPWNNPDEPAHFNYVVHVARTGTLPVLQEGDWDSAYLERLKSDHFRGGEPIDAIRYESWQPPVYYVVAAQLVRLVPDQQAARVQALRAFGVLLGALTLLVAYAVARAFLHPRGLVALAPAVPGVIAGVPMFTAVSAAVTNDPLANLLAASLLLVLLRLLARPPQPRQAALLGLFLGLALLTKLTLAIFVPLAALTLAAPALRRQQRWSISARHLALMLGVLLLALAPYFVRQGLAYGWHDLLATARHDAVVVGQPRTPTLTPEYVVGWATTLFHSFWAQFGWMGIPVADRLYWAWGALSLAALGGLLLRALRGAPIWLQSVRARRWDPSLDLLLTTIAAAVALLLYYNLTFVQAQGRYLFTALVPLAILAVWGWSALLPHARLRVPATAALTLSLLALNYYTLTRFLTPAFAP